MTHTDNRARHSEHLRSYRQSAEFAEYARKVGFPVPEGKLPLLIGKRRNAAHCRSPLRRR